MTMGHAVQVFTQCFSSPSLSGCRCCFSVHVLAQSWLITTSFLFFNKGNLIVFAAVPIPVAPERMGFVVMVMVSWHRSSSDPVVVLWSAVVANSSFTVKHIVSMHCLGTLHFKIVLKKDSFDIQSLWNFTTTHCFVYERDTERTQSLKKESGFISKSFGEKVWEKTEHTGSDSPHTHTHTHQPTHMHFLASHPHMHLSPTLCSLTQSPIHPHHALLLNQKKQARKQPINTSPFGPNLNLCLHSLERVQHTPHTLKKSLVVGVEGELSHTAETFFMRLIS